MALEFIKTINDINNLEDKLLGKLPINREELIAIVNTHGRKQDGFFIEINEYEYFIKDQNPKECLPLENLDVSEINDFSFIFQSSLYNGDLSKWNVSNAKDLNGMFMNSEFNNDSLKYLDFQNIKYAIDIFYDSKFCGDISNWINYENTNLYDAFNKNQNFKKKYYPNDEKYLMYTEDVIKWLNNNLDRIKEMNKIEDEIIFDYFDFDDEITLERN